jgi:ATP-binding cassette, subfamily B, bacterial
VAFRYPGAEYAALRDVSFAVPPGEPLALVGESGAGKSTLVKLMARLYDPTDGRILLDGVDLRCYDPNDLRDQLAIVWQDFVRYELTVRENIGIGCVAALDDENRLRAAARASSIDAFVERLPRQYDEMLGRRFAGGVIASGTLHEMKHLERNFGRTHATSAGGPPSGAVTRGYVSGKRSPTNSTMESQRGN